MLKHPYGFVRLGVKVFQVLAWITLALQEVIGLWLLIAGGEAVALGGAEVPARLIGLLNCVSGALYFFMLMLTSQALRLLLDLRDQAGGRAA